LENSAGEAHTGQGKWREKRVGYVRWQETKGIAGYLGQHLIFMS